MLKGRVRAALAAAAVLIALALAGADPAFAQGQPPQPASATQAYVEVFGLTEATALNVRAGPSVQFPVVGVIRPGTLLRDLGCQPSAASRWCQIQTTSAPIFSGWASGRFLRPVAGAAAAPPPTTATTSTTPSTSAPTGPVLLEIFGTPSNALNVRAGPSISAPVVGVVTVGVPLRELGCDPVGWCQVETTTGPKISGWASRRYLRPSTTATLPVAPEPPAPALAPTPPALPVGPPQGVKCSVDSNRCVAEARRICPGLSYQLLGSESHAGGLISDAAPGPVTWFVMTFQCGPTDGRQPDFPFRGPPLTDATQLPGGVLIGAGGEPVPLESMQAFCRGAAAERFGQRPTDILTLPVQLNQSTYQVHGQFPPSGANVTLFTCQFGGDRVFLSIR